MQQCISLETPMIILFYGEYTLSVGKMGDSYKDSVYMFDTSIRIWHCIFSVSFRFPFRSVPFSVPRFSNTPIMHNFIYIMYFHASYVASFLNNFLKINPTLLRSCIHIICKGKLGLQS